MRAQMEAIKDERDGLQTEVERLMARLEASEMRSMSRGPLMVASTPTGRDDDADLVPGGARRTSHADGGSISGSSRAASSSSLAATSISEDDASRARALEAGQHWRPMREDPQGGGYLSHDDDDDGVGSSGHIPEVRSGMAAGRVRRSSSVGSASEGADGDSPSVTDTKTGSVAAIAAAASASAGPGLRSVSTLQRGWDTREEALLARVTALEAELEVLREGRKIVGTGGRGEGSSGGEEEDVEECGGEGQGGVMALRAHLAAMVEEHAALKGQLEETRAALMLRPLLLPPDDLAEGASGQLLLQATHRRPSEADSNSSIVRSEGPVSVRTAGEGDASVGSQTESAATPGSRAEATSVPSTPTGANVDDLQAKLALLTAWRTGAESTLLSLQSEIQVGIE